MPYGIRAKDSGVFETRWDGSPLEFDSETQATRFLGEYFPFGTREVAELPAVAA